VQVLISPLFSMQMTLSLCWRLALPSSFSLNLLHTFTASTGLIVNYSKSVMVPLNITDGKLQELATLFDCQKGSLPFTYLGLPLGTTKPNIQDFMPLMQRIEKRLSCTSMFLSQGGKLELVKLVFPLLQYITWPLSSCTKESSSNWTATRSIASREVQI
jgi:hypothetical protein